MDRKILTYDSVEISFGGKAVVHDVSFSLEHGEILGLVGESGSGKSTLIKAAMGLLGSDGLVTRGDIRYMDQNILDIPEKEKRKIRGAGIGMIFQDAGDSHCRILPQGQVSLHVQGRSSHHEPPLSRQMISLRNRRSVFFYPFL